MCPGAELRAVDLGWGWKIAIGCSSTGGGGWGEACAQKLLLSNRVPSDLSHKHGALQHFRVFLKLAGSPVVVAMVTKTPAPFHFDDARGGDTGTYHMLSLSQTSCL